MPVMPIISKIVSNKSMLKYVHKNNNVVEKMLEVIKIHTRNEDKVKLHHNDIAIFLKQ